MNFSLSQRIRTQEVSEPRLLLVDDIKNVQSPFRRVARKLVPRQILSYLTSGKGWRDVGRVWRVEEHRRRAFCGESPWFDQTQLHEGIGKYISSNPCCRRSLTLIFHEGSSSTAKDYVRASIAVKFD